MPLGSALQGLTTLALVALGSLFAGRVMRRIGQPAVLGPIVLGLLSGSALAGTPESVRAVLVPESSRGILETAGTAGLLLLMFSVGVELRRAGRSGNTSIGWPLVPCVLLSVIVCAVAARPFADRIGHAGGGFGWVFVGVALGVTAVPVLVLILQELDIAGTPVGRTALGISIGSDAFAWLVVTAMVVVSHFTALSVPELATGAVLLAASILGAPALAQWAVPRGRLGPPVIVMGVSALVGAAATQLLGFHPAIGALVAGFCFPGPFIDAAAERTFSGLVDVLLPAFFVSVAMLVPLGTLGGHSGPRGAICAAILTLAAFASKMAAGLVYGATQRWPWWTSAGLGALLNCRGVTEIAIASVGFQAGLIGPSTFALLCYLAIVSTVVTTPLYRALTPGPRHRNAGADSGPAR